MHQVYRFNGKHSAKGLPDRLAQALAHFQTTYHASPSALIVGPKHADFAKGLTTLPVVVVGGCLADEVWLEVEGEDYERFE